MPVTETHLPGQLLDGPRTKEALSFVSLNDAFRESMKKQQAAASGPDIIARCEVLPKVAAAEKDMNLLFELLVSMIFSRLTPEAKLFLFVDCMLDEDRNHDIFLNGEIKTYLIRFYSNLSADAAWIDEHNEILAQCRQLLAGCNGMLNLCPPGSTGWLFSVSLPGKLV